MGPRGFWGALRRPIFVMAPMIGVTDCAFRRIIAKYGKPDVLWTEFVSVNAMLESEKSYKKCELLLKYSESERPIVAQLFGRDPKLFYEATKMVKELGFDGVDINMGCPEHNICSAAQGSSLIKEPELAKEIIAACRRAAGDSMPVSVKTRIGYNEISVEEWIPHLLEAAPDGAYADGDEVELTRLALTLHLRTRKEMSKVAAHWEHGVIGKAVELVRASKSPTLILGNGDVKGIAEARAKINEFGIDGVMIGRGIFGQPWLFNEGFEVDLRKKIEIMVEHTDLWEELLGDRHGFYDMRKHYKCYVVGFRGAKQFRQRMLTTEAPKDARLIAKEILDYLDAGLHLTELGGDAVAAEE